MLSCFVLFEMLNIADVCNVLVQVVQLLAFVALAVFVVLLDVVKKCLALDQGGLVHVPIVLCWALADIDEGHAANVGNTKNMGKGSGGALSNNGFVALQTDPHFGAIWSAPSAQFWAIPNRVEMHWTLWFLAFCRCNGCLVCHG